VLVNLLKEIRFDEIKINIIKIKERERERERMIRIKNNKRFVNIVNSQKLLQWS